eukprot:14603817-Ditylum_brightwellii.AAC.1
MSGVQVDLMLDCKGVSCCKELRAMKQTWYIMEEVQHQLGEKIQKYLSWRRRRDAGTDQHERQHNCLMKWKGHCLLSFGKSELNGSGIHFQRATFLKCKVCLG